MTATSTATYDRTVAAEVRAVAARRGFNQRDLAGRLGVDEFWVSRRLSARAQKPVELKVSDVARLAAVLDVPIGDLLPRLDSNQQPSAYQSLVAA